MWLLFIDFSIEFLHSSLEIIRQLKLKGKCQFLKCSLLVSGREG